MRNCVQGHHQQSIESCPIERTERKTKSAGGDKKKKSSLFPIIKQDLKNPVWEDKKEVGGLLELGDTTQLFSPEAHQ